MTRSIAHEQSPARARPARRAFQARPLTEEQRAILAKLAVNPIVHGGRLPDELGARIRTIARQTARWAMRALVLADGTTILADDFYTYICSETLVRAVRYGRLSAKLLRRIARNRARDFWRLAENYPLGLAQYDQRAVEPEPVRRDEYNADVIGVDALEYNNHIADALQGLSLRQRRVVAALAWGCTLREVAAVLGVSLATAQRDRAAAERALRRSRH